MVRPLWVMQTKMAAIYQELTVQSSLNVTVIREEWDTHMYALVNMAGIGFGNSLSSYTEVIWSTPTIPLHS